MKRVGKYILVILFAGIIMLANGCKRNEVKVEFKLPQSVTDTYNMIFYASDPVKGWYVENVASVESGKAEMILATRNPTVVLILGNGAVPRAGFYAERGDKIKIAGADGDPTGWEISGNKMTQKWNEWRLANAKVLKAGNAKGINEAVTAFVKGNPDNPLSTLLIQIYYDRRENEEGFRKTWNMLKGDALQPKWIRMVGRADLLTDSPEYREGVKRMIVASAGNGVDTIEFKGKPLMIYFWREDDSDRSANIERFKATAKEFGDSAKRILADISFDPDSSGWSYRMRRDTVKKAIRGWIYSGEADSVVSMLRVPGTPWFVVSDAKGKFRYEGADGSQADSVFRTLMK
ncbi:MAG: hypothetical protein K2K97_10300 [Muribaculaceae bacterium]|nr:hypothetical protein [Muribaculaceae bacterium]